MALMKGYLIIMLKKMSGLNKKKVLLALVIFVLGVIAFILCKDMFYGIDIHGRRLLLKKMVAIYFANIFVYCFTILWENHLSEKTNSIINFHILEWYPLVCFIIAESTMGTGSVMVELNLRRILLNTALYMLVFYLIYVISASIKASVIGLTVFTVLFSAANIYLLRFRQIPLIATDFMVARTALNVAKDYDYTPDANILILLCYLVGVVLLCRKLQENKDIRTWKAKDVAEGIGISSRGVSGAFRKLVNDGFCEKLGQNPVIYCLTEKGTNYIIEDEQGE